MGDRDAQTILPPAPPPLTPVHLVPRADGYTPIITAALAGRQLSVLYRARACWSSGSSCGRFAPADRLPSVDIWGALRPNAWGHGDHLPAVMDILPQQREGDRWGGGSARHQCVKVSRRRRPAGACDLVGSNAPIRSG